VPFMCLAEGMDSNPSCGPGVKMELAVFIQTLCQSTYFSCKHLGANAVVGWALQGAGAMLFGHGDGGIAGAGGSAGEASAMAPEAAGPARVSFGPGTEKAWNVLDRVLEKGSPLLGYKGGSVFQNLDGRLPSVDGAGNPITYREWDVNPYVKGVNRGPERLVTGSDGSAFYTGDHYNSFLQFWGPGQ
jgi:guanyl-specific ribonuclease Sa